MVLGFCVCMYWSFQTLHIYIRVLFPRVSSYDMFYFHEEHYVDNPTLSKWSACHEVHLLHYEGSANWCNVSIILQITDSMKMLFKKSPIMNVSKMVYGQKNQFYLMLLDVSRGISVMDVTIMLCTYYGPIQISDLV